MARTSIFTHEPFSSPKSNYFDLGHDVKMSSKFGQLAPILIQETLPSGKYKLSSENLIRFAPMLAPIMHKVKAHIHYFFVPNRILWDEFEDFITGGKNGDLNPPIPRISVDNTTFDVGSLGDYLGFPTDVPIAKEDFNLFALAAYQKIFYDYYVDPNLDDSEFTPLRSGANNDIAEYNIKRNRAWRKDYFTSALPWAQRGPSVTLPMGDYAPIFVDKDGQPNSKSIWDAENNQDPGTTYQIGAYNNRFDPDAPASGILYTDLKAATATTITELRRAESLQEFFEKLARGGHRYFEVLQRMFGVRNLDARLNRAEFIGAQTQDVVISEVLQTSETGETPLADMAGHALSVSKGGRTVYTAPEHGYIIGILSVMPNAAYQQGLPRHFSRNDRFDFYWEQFAHIGEQEILNKELYYQNNANKNVPFGYTPRYAEYKYTPNRVCGDFKTSLNFWHLGRKFANEPQLNTDFVYIDPNADYLRNIFNVTDPDLDYLWLHCYNTVDARLPMPKFGVPRI